MEIIKIALLQEDTCKLTSLVHKIS